MDPSNYQTGSQKPIFWFEFLDLTDQDSYKAYMQAIQTSHVDLHWFKFGDELAVREGKKAGMNKIGIWADEHEPVRIRDDKSDNFLGIHKAPCMIMLPKKEKIENHQADYNACEIIAKDIISKLLKDYTDGIVATEVSEYQFGKAEINFDGNDYIGCRLDIQWLAPVDVTYKAEKWQ
jgi:hypothetical protein